MLTRRLDSKSDLVFQNLLSPIVENAQLAALEITDGVDTALMPEMLEGVRMSVARAGQVLQHLLWHASGGAEIQVLIRVLDAWWSDWTGSVTGRTGPNHAASRFVAAGGVRFHVQVMGRGPVLLLLHGTGAATHSWRDLAPRLAGDFTVVAPDLPGHGFSDMTSGSQSMTGMAQALAALLGALGLQPVLAVGHSAGAAILARMTLDGLIAPRALAASNGALLPMRGVPAQVFSPAARLLARLPGIPRLFTSMVGDRKAVERLLRDTGSVIDADGITFYGPAGAQCRPCRRCVGMMAAWDLQRLARDLPQLKTPLTLVAGRGDRTISPAEAFRVKAIVPGASVIFLPGLGHLAHEERPADIAGIIAAQMVAA